MEGVGHFEHKFQTERTSPTDHCWCRKTRAITLLCGIKISAVHCIVWFCHKVWVWQTDRRTELQLPRPHASI